MQILFGRCNLFLHLVLKDFIPLPQKMSKSASTTTKFSKIISTNSSKYNNSLESNIEDYFDNERYDDMDDDLEGYASG